jgi:hypothetical protein
LNAFFGLRWHGSPLADRAVNLPADLRLPVDGGSDIWERSQVAWELGRTLSEFEGLDQEDQEWALAVWRTKRKLGAIEALESYNRQQAGRRKR